MAEEIEGVAVDTNEEETKSADRIDLNVEITEAGPCQKHVKVIILRAEVNRFFDKEYSDLVKSANVPGFRPGKTPRRLIERKFKKDVATQVKAGLMMQSFEQVFEDQKIDALDQPDVDVKNIEIPDEGDFIYEFDVEVRPDFDVPQYKGLKLEKPVKQFDEQDIDKGVERFMRSRGTLQVSEGNVVEGGYVVADVRFMDGSEVVREFSDLTTRVEKTLYFKDGAIEGFAAGIVGAAVGDTREFDANLADSVGRENLRGKAIKAIFVIQQVKELVLPELNQEFFDSIGVSDEAELRDLVSSSMKYRMAHKQKQVLGEQITEALLGSVNFDLPPELLRKQAERTLRRKVDELKSSGYEVEEIRNISNQIRQQTVAHTARSLRQQFILQRIAEEENIKVDEEELENAVMDIASRTGESYRRVRARVEQEQLWDGIALQVLEGKTIDLIVSYAELTEVPFVDDEVSSSGVDESAVPDEEVSSVGDEESSKAEETNG